MVRKDRIDHIRYNLVDIFPVKSVLDAKLLRRSEDGDEFVISIKKDLSVSSLTLTPPSSSHLTRYFSLRHRSLQVVHHFFLCADSGPLLQQLHVTRDYDRRSKAESFGQAVVRDSKFATEVGFR
jgi:hypothetical protein